MWVSLKEKEKNNNKKLKSKCQTDGMMDRTFRRIFFYFFFSLVFLKFMETCPSDFVGINTKSALRDEGYA